MMPLCGASLQIIFLRLSTEWSCFYGKMVVRKYDHPHNVTLNLQVHNDPEKRRSKNELLFFSTSLWSHGSITLENPKPAAV